MKKITNLALCLENITKGKEREKSGYFSHRLPVLIASVIAPELTIIQQLSQVRSLNLLQQIFMHDVCSILAAFMMEP